MKKNVKDVQEEKDYGEEMRNERHNRGRNKGSKKSGKRNPKLQNMKGQTEATNDISWYAQYPELVNSSASFPYSWPLGNIIHQFPGDGYIFDRPLPGIMTFDVILTPGRSTDATSPITLASRNLYAWIRHDNSGSKNYEAVDLINYVMAMDTAYAMYAHLCRAFVYLLSLNPENKYYPRAIVEAMGFDYSDLYGKGAQLEFLLEEFRVKLQKCSMPSHLPLFERHRWMFSGVYTDGSTSKAQTYLFKPAGYHVWTEGTDPNQPGYLKWKTIPRNALWTYDDISNLIDELMNPILGSDDFNLIAGDIRKSFQGDIYQVAQIEQFITLPAYDPEVMSQIQNLTIPRIDFTTLDITQNPNINAGYLIFDPKVNLYEDQTVQTGQCRNKIITLDLNDPKAGDTMIATRLTNMPRFSSISLNKASFVNIGSEIVSRMTIYSIGPDGRTDVSSTTGCDVVPVTDENLQSTVAVLKFIDDISKFDKHPEVLYMGSVDQTAICGSIADYDKYSVLTPEDLARMHEAAMLSLFTWPQIPH